MAEPYMRKADGLEEPAGIAARGVCPIMSGAPFVFPKQNQGQVLTGPSGQPVMELRIAEVACQAERCAWWSVDGYCVVKDLFRVADGVKHLEPPL